MAGAVNELPQVGAWTIRLVPAAQGMEEEYNRTLQHCFQNSEHAWHVCTAQKPTLYKHANAYENA